MTEIDEKKREEIAKQMNDFRTMMPKMIEQITPMAAQFSQQITSDMTDIKRALAAIYRRIGEVEAKVDAIQKS